MEKPIAMIDGGLTGGSVYQNFKAKVMVTK
jgi:hypothetical protein